jgi:hypothetical protein
MLKEHHRDVLDILRPIDDTVDWKDIDDIYLKEVRLEGGDLVEVVGSLSRVADPTAEALGRQGPERLELTAGENAVTVIPLKSGTLVGLSRA